MNSQYLMEMYMRLKKNIIGEKQTDVDGCGLSEPINENIKTSVKKTKTKNPLMKSSSSSSLSSSLSSLSSTK